MKNVWKAFPLVLLALAFAAGTRAIPSLSASVQSPESKSLMGELVKVDLENKTFTIKSDDDEIMFQYDQELKVEGRENGIQGLATETGIQITVYYTEEDGKRLASKIEIKKSDG